MKKDDPKAPPFLPLPPLKITCTSSNCEQDLHCFKATRKMQAQGEQGTCRACGAELVDWDRVFKRDLIDVRYTFEALKFELIRHHFWHKDFDEMAVAHARRKGRLALREAAWSRIRQSVGNGHPFRDGMQTPMEGNLLYYAQHATACCCRKCIEEWHGIPAGQDLTPDQVDYLVNLVWLYIDDRMPNLRETGEKVPPVRRTNRGTSN